MCVMYGCVWSCYVWMHVELFHMDVCRIVMYGCVWNCYVWMCVELLCMDVCGLVNPQPIQFTGIKYSFFIILGGYGHVEKWIQQKIIFMRFCCCFKPNKKIQKLSNELPTNTIAKCTLTGLVQ